MFILLRFLNCLYRLYLLHFIGYACLLYPAELIRCIICWYLSIHLKGFWRVLYHGNVFILLYIWNRCTGFILALNCIMVISDCINKNSSNPSYTGSLLFIMFIFCRFLLFGEFGNVFIWLNCQNRLYRKYGAFKLIPVIK